MIFAISTLVAFGITVRTRQHQQLLNKEKEKAQITLHSIGEGVVSTNDAGHVESMNTAAEKLTGWKLSEATGKSLTDVFTVFNAGDENVVTEMLAAVLEGSGAFSRSEDIVLIRKDSSEYTVEATAAPILNDEQVVTGSVIVFRDVTRVRALGQELHYQARHDSLTGIYNRHEFEHRLQQVIALARSTGEASALCYLDLDLFKVINDTSGHAAGDELLRQIAKLLDEHVRRHDVLARLGGDEFGVLLEGCDLKKAENIAGGIRQAIAEFRFVWEDNSYELGVSVGVVPVEPDSGTLIDVMRSADIACYAAKDRGRNQVCVYSADDLTLVRRQGEMGWVQQIRQAMDENRFCLAFQPISSLSESNKPLLEILVRIESGDELATPDSFMPAAERYHMAPMIDRWIIENAVKFIDRLPIATREAVGNYCLNLSGQSLSEPDMLSFVVGILEKYKVSPKLICFEITETAAITNLSSARVFMDALKKKGCNFSLDDFGSGLSSFAYLKTLPVDYLKIDGTFVREIATDETDLAMVSSINQVSQIMGIRTVAEHVESKAILEQALKIGVDYAQGYYIGMPVACNQDNLELFLEQSAHGDRKKQQ
jgi:Amt family ammonium transporter